MNTSEINKLDLHFDQESIYNCSLSIENMGEIDSSESDKRENITVKVNRGNSTHSKSHYPMIEYSHESMKDFVNTISNKMQSILNRPIHTLLNPSCDPDLVITLYSEKTLTDRQRNLCTLCTQSKMIEELVHTLHQQTTQTQEDTGDSIDTEECAPSAPNNPTETQEDTEVCAPFAPTEPQVDTEIPEVFAIPAPPVPPDLKYIFESEDNNDE